MMDILWTPRVNPDEDKIAEIKHCGRRFQLSIQKRKCLLNEIEREGWVWRWEILCLRTGCEVARGSAPSDEQAQWLLRRFFEGAYEDSREQE